MNTSRGAVDSPELFVVITTQAILLGGHVRVGLEDNTYYARGELATNEQLVARTVRIIKVRIIKELGREPTSAGEARDRLGLPTR